MTLRTSTARAPLTHDSLECLQRLTKEWWSATADSLPQAVTCQL